MTKNTAIDFDFNDLALEESAELHLNHPKTGSPLYAPVAKGEDEESRPVKIAVYGPASAQYRAAMDRMQKQNNKRGKRDATLEEAREQNVAFLASLSINISNIKFDGEEVTGADAFRKLYSNPKYEWVTKQVSSFVFEDSNYFLK